MTEWTKKQYNKQYENWMPWVEDTYLYYFGKDNKTSYAARGELDKTKITGDSSVGKLQDSVNDTAASQVGKGGLGEGVGNLVSREGVNRAERGGKDERGNYLPQSTGDITNPVVNAANTTSDNVVGGAKSAGEGVTGAIGGGAKKASGWVPGWGGKDKPDKK